MYVRKYLKQFTIASFILAFALTACNFFDRATLPNPPIEIPDLADIPGIPDSLKNVPGLLEDLELPDLSKIADLPGLSDLPAFQREPGTLSLRGPTDKKVEIGERIPGTDIELWPGTSDITYNLRLRIYNISNSNVRAAGVQQLIVSKIQPMSAPPQKARIELKFPHTASARVGELIDGTTFGYVGQHERGAEISGLAEGDYPYRKTGDSIKWNGLLRSDIPIEYRLRVLLAREESINVGGTVAVYLP